MFPFYHLSRIDQSKAHDVIQARDHVSVDLLCSLISTCSRWFQADCQTSDLIMFHLQGSRQSSQTDPRPGDGTSLVYHNKIVEAVPNTAKYVSFCCVEHILSDKMRRKWSWEEKFLLQQHRERLRYKNIFQLLKEEITEKSLRGTWIWKSLRKKKSRVSFCWCLMWFPVQCYYRQQWWTNVLMKRPKL